MSRRTRFRSCIWAALSCFNEQIYRGRGTIPDNRNVRFAVGYHIFLYDSVADPGFSWGGAQKIMCPHAHYERKTELTFGMGPRALHS